MVKILPSSPTETAGDGPPDAAPTAPQGRPRQPPILPNVSIVGQTMAEARRALALALAGAALLIGCLLVERIWLARAQEAATLRLTRTQALASQIDRVDERLTSASELVVSTGSERWVKEYDALRSTWGSALNQAKALAPARQAQRFDAQTRSVDEELTSMRQSAFEAVSVGSKDVAQTIFYGRRYQESTRLLATATAELTSAALQASHDEVSALKRRTFLVDGATMLAALVLGVALWRRLDQRLELSRAVLLDAEGRMQKLASSDMLTGLANRAALHDAMTASMVRAERSGRALAVLMIDLDRFKPVNDRHGHMIGDLVLKEVALRLSRCLRGGELRARYGGDEFVVAIEENEDASIARKVAERILLTLEQPIAIGNLTILIGASAGIARFPADATGVDDLLRMADSALYRAKTRGRGCACFYETALDEQVADRAALEQAVRDGIAGGQFVPYFQPIVELATGRVQSVEMLCRWEHPQRGLQMPDYFIPLAEDCGLIGPMMLSLLHQACRELPRFPAHWRLSINVAPHQMLDANLVPLLLKVLDEHGVAPARLDVELTETALVSDTAMARQVMQSLKEAGITVTLDDFGSGYSSLCYLAEMSFDKIKIDRSFVRTLHARPESAKVVSAVIGLSRTLGVQTVAEGVESERDAEALLELGCALAQGYLFGRPLPAAGLLQALEIALC